MEKPSPMFNLQQFFPYQFSILAGQISDYIAQIYKEKYGLTKFEWRVVATVGQHHQISAKAICEFTHLDKMQVSRAIAKLTTQGLIEQQVSDGDRRTYLLNLTAQGETIYSEIMPLVKAQEQQMLAGLSVDEREMLLMLTQKLSSQLVDKDEE